MIFAHEFNLEDKIEFKLSEKVEIQLCKNYIHFQEF